jgi:hypothetical protein
VIHGLFATLATCELERILGIVSVTAVLLPEEKIIVRLLREFLKKGKKRGSESVVCSVWKFMFLWCFSKLILNGIMHMENVSFKIII